MQKSEIKPPVEASGIRRVLRHVRTVMAGPGDLMVMVRSREAALSLQEHKFVPVDLAIIGIVDELVVRPDGEFDYELKEGWVKYT